MAEPRQVEVDYDPFAAPSPTSPVQGPRQVPVDYDPFNPEKPPQTQNVVPGVFGNADAAAKAKKLAPVVDQPASVIALDPEKYQRDANSNAGTKATSRNSAINEYAKSPVNATVSHDDWDGLEEASASLRLLHPELYEKKVQAGVWQGIQEVASLATSAPGREKLLDALTKLPKALLEGVVDFAKTAGDVASGAIDLNTEEGMNKAISLGIGVALGGAGRPSTPTSFGRDIRFGRKADTGPAEAGGIDRSSPAAIEDFLATLRGMKTREEMDAFIKNKAAQDKAPEVLQLEDMNRRAEVGAETLNDAVTKMNETKTKERSVEAADDFTAAHGDLGTVHLPAYRVLELYEAEGKVPMKGDGLFGFVPNLARTLDRAVETGEEIAVPAGKYVANVDPAVHEKLADEVRLQEKGVTRKEVEEAKEEAEAKAAPSEPVVGDYSHMPEEDPLPPPASGFIRYYHGTAYEDASGFTGKTFVSPQYKYARDYHGGPNNVLYTDLSLAEAESRGLIDEVNRYPIIGSIDDGASVLKPVMPRPAPSDAQATEVKELKDPVAASVASEVEKERKSFYLNPLFKSQNDLRITKTEFKQYSDKIDRANEAILTKAVNIAAGFAKARQTVEWAANKAKVEAEVEKDQRKDPAFLADRYFNWAKGTLPNGKKILESHFVEMGEAKADEWAPVFGFKTGSEMTKAVLEAEEERKDTGVTGRKYWKDKAAVEVDRRMEARYGNLEENIHLQASEIALQDFNVDLLATEWRMLAKEAGVTPPLNRDQLTVWANEQFLKANAAQTKYEYWRRASERAGRETEKALLKGDYEEAFKQKQSQMLSFLLARDAKVFEKEQARTKKLIAKYTSQSSLDNVDQRYTDQIHALLQKYEIPTRRTEENVQYNTEGKELGKFIDERNAENGDLIPQPVLPAKREDFTIANAKDFSELLTALDHSGRQAKQIELRGKTEDYIAVIEQIARNMDALGKEKEDAKEYFKMTGVVSVLRKVGREVDSRLLKAEKLIDWIDHKDPLGPFNSAVLRPLIEGEQNKGFTVNKIAKLVGELPGGRKWGRSLKDLTKNEGNLALRDSDGVPLKMTRENMIAIALNYGNKGNKNVMLKGHRWTEGEVEDFLDKNMTDMDWKMVDGFYGLFKELGPLVEKVTKERSGLAIPLITPEPFLKSKGGYFPLRQDPRDVLIGARQQTDLFDKTTFNPLPMSQALKERTGSVYRLDLSLDNLHSVISQMIHAVHMQTPVINANKVLKDSIVRGLINDSFGPEYVGMLDAWIKDIANNGGAADDRGAAWLSRNVRENVVTMLMGWKASTALIHGGSAAASTLYEMGKMHLRDKGPVSFALAPMELIKNVHALGLGQFLPDASRRFFANDSQLWETYQWAQATSRELPQRQRTLQKDFGYQVQKIVAKNYVDDAARIRAVHQTYAMALVSYLDLLTATPVFKATYDKAMVEGHTEADAVFIADKAVREAHGSASLVSRANIGRGEASKWLTIAYNGYWNHNYNKSREAFKEVFTKEPEKPEINQPRPGMGDILKVEGPEEQTDPRLTGGMKFAIGAAFLTAMIVGPALIHEAVRGKPNEDLTDNLPGILASQMAGQIPVVGGILYSVAHNRDPQISPVEAALKSAADVLKDAMTFARGDEPKKPISNALRLSGMATGLPATNQVIDTGSFMYGVLMGEKEPESVGEWANGIMTGKIQGYGGRQ